MTGTAGREDVRRIGGRERRWEQGSGAHEEREQQGREAMHQVRLSRPALHQWIEYRGRTARCPSATPAVRRAHGRPMVVNPARDPG